jgi:predicted glycosyltransferase
VKLWIDVLTPKQALFAKALADRAPSKVKCTLTTRKYPELDQFLRKLKLRTLAFGKHGGADLGEKLKASLEREIELYNYVKEHDFDCSLSFISPEAARVSFGLGIPHYISSDSPHAKAACRLAVPLARSLFYPFPIKAERWTQYGLKKSQIHSYHALDPWAWISKTKIDSGQERSVIIRLEESFASYFESGSGVSDVIDHLIRIIPPTFEIIVIARYPEQRAWAAKKFGKKCTVPKGVVDATALISCSSLVIGGGGTMTQEAALLGIPNISYFPSARLDVFENFYFPRKLSVRASNPAELVRETKRLVQNIELERKDFSLRAEKEVRHFEDPAKFIFEKLDALN